MRKRKGGGGTHPRIGISKDRKKKLNFEFLWQNKSDNKENLEKTQ